MRPATVLRAPVPNASPNDGQILSEAQAYACFGLAIRSSMALPDLERASAEYGGEPVAIVAGNPWLDPEDGMPPGLSLRQGGGEVYLTIPGIARYGIDQTPSRITVHAAPGASPQAIRLFLLGSALGVVAHQRELLLLHANAVTEGGRAFAFAGESGAGKSTLAGHFARDGWPVLSDDVCALSARAEAPPIAFPGVRRLKLWADAAVALQHDTRGLERVVEGRDKFNVPLSGGTALPAPLARVYVLERGAEDHPGRITRLHGAEAAQILVAHTYRREYLQALGLAVSNFRLCIAVARSIEVYRVSRAWGFAHYERQLDGIRDHVMAENPPDEVSLAPPTIVSVLEKTGR